GCVFWLSPAQAIARIANRITALPRVRTGQFTRCSVGRCPESTGRSSQGTMPRLHSGSIGPRLACGALSAIVAVQLSIAPLRALADTPPDSTHGVTPADVR